MTPCVLVIDDEPALRRTIERVLRRIGYDVVTAGDADSAYAVLGERTVDAVLLDIRMPVVSGETLYFAIVRRWPVLLGRIILMSGDFWSIVDEWPEALRACPRVDKPFDVDVLGRTVTAVARPQAAASQRRQNGQ